MQQRQLRLGDVLDDYCPRERRLTNHAIVAMVGDDVKQTRCTTCDTEHEYKHAKVPRQRRKSDAPAALYSQVVAGAPKRVAHENVAPDDEPVTAFEAETPDADPLPDAPADQVNAMAAAGDDAAADAVSDAPDALHDDEEREDADGDEKEEGPVHRPLIRATLPRVEGQAPPTRPAPDFTIRQPATGRPSRFRPRHPRGGAAFQGGGGNTNGHGGAPRFAGNGNRPPQGGGLPRPPRRGDQNRQNRKRFK